MGLFLDVMGLTMDLAGEGLIGGAPSRGPAQFLDSAAIGLLAGSALQNKRHAVLVSLASGVAMPLLFMNGPAAVSEMIVSGAVSALASYVSHDLAHNTPSPRRETEGRGLTTPSEAIRLLEDTNTGSGFAARELARRKQSTGYSRV